MPWNARVLALVEDHFFEHVGILRMLQSWFWDVGIPYWSVAAMHQPTYLKYFLEHANQTILVNAPLDFDTVYTYRRMKNEHRVTVVYHYLNSLPYTFLNPRKRIDGIDYVLFGLLFEYLKLDAKLVHIRKRTESETRDMLMRVVQNLLDQHIDFMMTRRVVDIKFLPMFVVPEPITFCLVVPRQRNLQLFSSLIQPFTSELWISLACGVAAAYGVKLLTQTETKLGRLMKRFLNGPLMGSFIDITLDILSFVLIESYLAQITSLLLVQQYRRDPQTLEEFFATDIPIQMLESHDDFLLSLSPNVSKAIMKRAVVMETKMELLSEQYAYFDSVGRAAYSLTMVRKVDPITGLRANFILQQPLISSPTAYLFARNAAPLRDYFALHLEWMRAFGFMHLVDVHFVFLQTMAAREEDHISPYQWAEPVPLKTSVQRFRALLETVLNVLMFALESIPLWWEALAAQFRTPRMKIISGQTALVTGGANGLGQAIAISLAKEGCNVAVVDVDETNAQETVAKLRRYNVSAEAYKVDVSDYEAVRQLGRDVERDLGPVDILVNNAGILPTSFSVDALPSHAKRSMEVNVLSGFWTTQTFIDSMIRRRKGHIVAVSSIAGYIAPGWAKTYAATKFAIRGFMDALEDDLYLRGQAEHVRTTTVFPFTFNTRKQAIRLLKSSSGLTRLSIYEPALLGECVVKAIKTNQRKLVVPGPVSPFQLSIFENMPVKVRQLLTRTMAQGEVKLVD
uniref:Short-chain dehydrogenase/reductase 3 n=1 Tax=Anopheles farauti TaxID=69004 RepID=A0A182QKV4_9DIPT